MYTKDKETSRKDLNRAAFYAVETIVLNGIRFPMNLSYRKCFERASVIAKSRRKTILLPSHRCRGRRLRL
jgi:hypothetical protein